MERQHLEGDIVEFECAAGRTTEKLARYGRRVFALDTFEGMPKFEYQRGLDRDEPGKFCPPADTLARLQKLPNVFPIMGRFIQTLWVLQPVRVVLAYVDCDLYQSAADAFCWLSEHMVEGGAIVLDDYATHPGIRRAVQHFIDCNPRAEFNGRETILGGGDADPENRKIRREAGLLRAGLKSASVYRIGSPMKIPRLTFPVETGLGFWFIAWELNPIHRGGFSSGLSGLPPETPIPSSS